MLIQSLVLQTSHTAPTKAVRRVGSGLGPVWFCVGRVGVISFIGMLCLKDLFFGGLGFVWWVVWWSIVWFVWTNIVCLCLKLPVWFWVGWVERVWVISLDHIYT